MFETNAFYEIMLKFFQVVDMKDIFVRSFEIVAVATLILALLSCFLGYRLVRIFSAVTAFFLTAIAAGELLQSSAHLGVIVITFAVAGIIVAFIVYQQHKFCIFLLSATIIYSIAAIFTANIWICSGAAIILGAISIRFSPIVPMLSTSVWGGIVLGFEGLSYLNLNLPFNNFFASAVLSAAGLLIQSLIDRTQLIRRAPRNHDKNTANN